MTNIDGLLNKFYLSLLNDLSVWVISLALVLVLINIILEVFYDNSK